MTRGSRPLAEWHAELAARPATPNQVGVIRREMDRLGITDRADRLAVTAMLAGLGRLGSTKDLTVGEAGQLVRALPGFRTRAELEAAAGLPAPVADRDAEDRAPRYRRKLVTVILRAMISQALQEAARKQREPGTMS